MLQSSVLDGLRSPCAGDIRRRSDKESGAQGRGRAREKFECHQHEGMRLEELPKAGSVGGEEGRCRA